MDAIGIKIFVLISELSLFQGKNDTCLYKGGTWLSVLVYHGVFISGVSSKRGSTLHL